LIDFRYHLVSIVAVFLALAIGIVLGSTELQGGALDALRATQNSLHGQLNEASAQRDAFAAQASAADSFVQASEKLLLGDGRLLSGHKIVLVTEPDAPGAMTDGVEKAATDAGATVTGVVALQPQFNDLSGSAGSTLSSINGSMAATTGVTLAQGTDPQTTYQQDAAQLIGTAILDKQAGQPAQQGQRSQQDLGGSGLSAATALTVLNAYAQAGFITVTGTPTDQADLMVIVTPGSVPAAGANDPGNLVLVAIADEFASASAVTVITGATAPSGQQGSAISVVRSSSVSGLVSTIDNADTTQGQITAMQAIAAQLAGAQPSSYGISGAASVSPAPAPTPTQVTPTNTQTSKPASTGRGGSPVKKK
jgi:hypothetical protein